MQETIAKADLGSSSPPAPPPAVVLRRAWWRFTEYQLPNIILGLLIIALILAILTPTVVYNILPGEVAVLWKRFGGGTQTEESQLRGEGIQLIAPWDKLYVYDLRLKATNETYNAITADGVLVNATVTVRQQLRRWLVGILHQYVGPDYLKLMVLPEIGNRAREVIAQYKAEDVYYNKRSEIQEEILRRTQERFEELLYLSGDSYGYIKLYDTLLLSIELPAPVVASINRKVDQFYAVQEWKNRWEREKIEADRKQTEADGIRRFQQTVGNGIMESYLRWRGIEATLQLAQSPNSKVVIIGAGKDGIPLILGNVDSPPQQQQQQQQQQQSPQPIDASTARPTPITDAPRPRLPLLPITPPLPLLEPGTQSGALLATPSVSPAIAETLPTPPVPPEGGAVQPPR